jgi:hypothetical protein
MFLQTVVRAQVLAATARRRLGRGDLTDGPGGSDGPGRGQDRGGDRGQATTEYGLVILVAGLIAMGVIAWARATGAFTDLFESVVDQLTAN